jgi:hypothetical protein
VSCDFEPEPSDPALPRAAFFFKALVGFDAFDDAFGFEAFACLLALAGFPALPAFDAVFPVAFGFEPLAGLLAFDAFDALALLLFFGFAMSLRPPAGC